MILEAIFFDNNQGSIDNLKENCEHVKLVKIDESSPDAESVPYEDPDFASYLASLSPNSYVDVMKIVSKHDVYDKRSGIQEKHVPIFTNWLLCTPKYMDRAAIFDFDRTLTMFEGFYNVPSFSKLQETLHNWLIQARDSNVLYRRFYQKKIDQLLALPNPTIRDMVVYLMGGEARLSMLRKLFQTCVSNNVIIAVLTNNTACKGALFDEILHELFQDIPYTKVCSNAARGKSQFLADDPRFGNLCFLDIYSGGAHRTRKTRKRQKAKKANRRRALSRNKH